jgi:hypothetical protein
LSGSRSRGDLRALSNRAETPIFKVPEVGEGDTLQKGSVSRSKSGNQRMVLVKAVFYGL